MTAEQAIQRSISHNEIVTLGSPETPADDAEATMAELFAECDDCADNDRVMAEYWGADEGGNEWRVHIWFR